MKIRYLTFECAARCNMNCKFCFSYWRDQPFELSTGEAKKSLQFLKEKGLEAINFTGGEPLLRKDIIRLIDFAKELGLTTILTTNGLLLKEKLPKLAESLDFIGLPLDSSDSKIHNSMRTSNIDHHKLVLELIDIIHEKYPRLSIKINTVVTVQNKNLTGIGNLVKGNIVSWKLSHFIPGEYGKVHNKEFEISAAEYNRIVTACKKTHPDLNIISSAAHTRDSSCRILSSEGRLLKPCNEGLQDLGTLFSITDKRFVDGFNEVMNSYFLDKTYPRLR